MRAHGGWDGGDRLAGLRRFAVAISVLNLLGHTVLGFEQAWIVPVLAVLSACATELLLETIDAMATRRPVRFRGGIRVAIDFLLSACITGLAVGMLLYANARLGAVVFAAVAAIASKAILRVHVQGVSRHVFNPSNFGISLTLVSLPWVGIAPPYQFTANVDAVGDWLLPALIVASGSFLNARYTHRLPVIAGRLTGFLAQALVRSVASGGPLAETFVPAILPMSGLAFVLYTFYMITDPATTPASTRAQVWFGLGAAAVYGVLVACHVVFGLFFSLTVVSAIRGARLVLAAETRRAVEPVERGASVLAARG